MKNNAITMDELQGMIFDIYDNLKVVLKRGAPDQKRRALESFVSLQLVIKEEVEAYENQEQIDFKRVEKVLIGAKGGFGEECEKFKKKMNAYQSEIDPLIEKVKDDVETPRTGKRRKGNMEKKLRSRE